MSILTGKFAASLLPRGVDFGWLSPPDMWVDGSPSTGRRAHRSMLHGRAIVVHDKHRSGLSLRYTLPLPILIH